MIIINVTFSPREDIHEEVMAAWADLVKASQAEPECITYAVSTDLLDPTVMRLYEEWESHQAVIDHMEMPHVQRCRDALAKLGENTVIYHSAAQYEAVPLKE